MDDAASFERQGKETQKIVPLDGSLRDANDIFYGKEKTTPVLPETITEESLNRFIEQVIPDNQLRSYQALGVYNQAKHTTEKLRQAKENAQGMSVVPLSRNRELTTAYLATMSEYYPASVDRYFSTMRRYTETKENFAKRFTFRPDGELLQMEAAAAEHLSAIGTILRDRLAIANYNLLKAKANPGDTRLDDVKRALPETVVRRAPIASETQAQSAVVIKRENPRDEDLIIAGQILEQNLTWMLSSTQASVSPADSLYLTLLLKCQQHLFEQEKTIDKEKGNENIISDIRAARRQLRIDTLQYTLGLSPSGRQLDVATRRGMWWDTQFSTQGVREAPKQTPMTDQQLAELKTHFDKQVLSDIGKYRAHFSAMNAENGPLSIGWKEHAEQQWNEKISPFLLSIATLYGSITAFPLQLAHDHVYGAGILLDSPEAYKEKLLGGLRRSFNLPPDFDFRKDWHSLSDEQRNAITQAMNTAKESTKTTIEHYRGLLGASMKKCNDDLAILEMLLTNHPPESVEGVNIIPNFDLLREKHLIGDSLNIESLKKETNPVVIAAAYDYLFEKQLEPHWQEYSLLRDAFQAKLESVMEQHFNRARGWESFGNPPRETPWLLMAYTAAYTYGGRKGIIPHVFTRFGRLSSFIGRPLNALPALALDIIKIRQKKGADVSPSITSDVHALLSIEPEPIKFLINFHTLADLAGDIVLAAYICDSVVTISRREEIKDDKERMIAVRKMLQQQALNPNHPAYSSALINIDKRIDLLSAKEKITFTIPNPAEAPSTTPPASQIQKHLETEYAELTKEQAQLLKHIDEEIKKRKQSFPIDHAVTYSQRKEQYLVEENVVEQAFHTLKQCTDSEPEMITDPNNPVVISIQRKCEMLESRILAYMGLYQQYFPPRSEQPRESQKKKEKASGEAVRMNER